MPAIINCEGKEENLVEKLRKRARKSPDIKSELSELLV